MSVPSCHVLVFRRPYTFSEQTYSQGARAGFSSRKTNAAVSGLAALRKVNDARSLQQSHWDDFLHTNEADIKEFHCVCDRNRVLECEYAALKR